MMFMGSPPCCDVDLLLEHLPVGDDYLVPLIQVLLRPIR
jgi:hypothetical protein